MVFVTELLNKAHNEADYIKEIRKDCIISIL